MSNFTAWLLLLGAGLVDVLWALSMKKNAGFSNLPWSLVSLVTVALFVWLLSRAIQVIPLGIAYAVWAGIGTIGTVVIGMVVFHEPIDSVRCGFIAMIAAGIIGLKLQSA